jgi:hypothetical protein
LQEILCSRRKISFDNIWAQVEKGYVPASKKRKKHSSEMMEDKYRRLNFWIQTTICFLLKCRLGCLSDFGFTEDTALRIHSEKYFPMTIKENRSSIWKTDSNV